MGERRDRSGRLRLTSPLRWAYAGLWSIFWFLLAVGFEGVMSPAQFATVILLGVAVIVVMAGRIRVVLDEDSMSVTFFRCTTFDREDMATASAEIGPYQWNLSPLASTWAIRVAFHNGTDRDLPGTHNYGWGHKPNKRVARHAQAIQTWIDHG